MRTKCKNCNKSKLNYIFKSFKVNYFICKICSHLNGAHEDTRQFNNYLYKENRGKSYARNYLSDYDSRVKNIYIPTKKELSSTSKMIIDNNENFVVINKPAGISVQSGTKSRRNILDILRGTSEFKKYYPYTVHRIDKDTTGLLIVAKNRKYAQLFTSLFRIRKIHKMYLGIVLGELPKNKGTFIDELVYLEGKKQIKVKAITHFTVIDSSKNYSLLKLIPETGRKHQLRKQLLLRGYPILGDSKYRFPN